MANCVFNPFFDFSSFLKQLLIPTETIIGDPTTINTMFAILQY